MGINKAWKNRIIESGVESPEQLLANPANFRTHPASQQDALAGVLDEVGWVQEVIVNRTTQHLIDGHLRVSLAMRRGEKTIPVKYVELTEAEEKLILATFDPISALATVDNAKLDELLQEVSTGSAAVQQMLAELAEDNGLYFGDDKPEAGMGGDEFDADKEEIPERCKAGDLWQLSNHRLLIGDCRNSHDVARLFGNDKANVVVTSPPYASQREYDKESGFEPIKPDKYIDWFDSVQSNIAAYLAKDGSYFLNIKEHCEDGQRHLYVKDLTIAHVRQWAWRFVDEFCWRDTKNGVPGGWNNRFKDAWEPVFHFTKKSNIKFNPLANATTSTAVFEYSSNTAKTNTGSGLLGVKATTEHVGLARPSNVIECAAASSGGHSAAYPVGLPEFFIKAFSDEGDIIFDPFLGSGTTMIAAERNQRKCYGTELSAKYGNVILARWQAETGQEPKLLERIEQD